MRESVLGGESAHRGMFGGRVSKARLWALAVTVGLSMLLIAFGAVLAGLISAVITVPLAILATMNTENDTMLTRALNRHRNRTNTRLGLNVFVPFEQGTLDQVVEEYSAASNRIERAEAMRKVRALRETPDGVLGMRWLRSTSGTAGIQWHQDPDGDEYLAVTFATAGQVAGIESQSYFDQCSESFGRLTASSGKALSLATRFQTLTRVLPPDSAPHEAWVMANLDEHAPQVFAKSYARLIRMMRRGQLKQRHMITASWPVTPRFIGQAGHRGDELDGWVRLMDEEIHAMLGRIRSAGFKDVSVLTARQTAAVIRHMQHPGFAIDKVSDVAADGGWLPSEDVWSYTRYTGAPAGVAGGLSSSLSRTARITAQNVEITGRTNLWLAPLLTSMSEQVVRTVSFHQEIVPQEDARYFADLDIVTDISDQNEKAKRGVLKDGILDVGVNAALRRQSDLQPGTGIHGANWVGYLTVSAGDERQLIEACDAAEAGASDAGINRLVWMDTQQASAAASCWPVGRGLVPAGRAAHMKVRQFVAGRGAKEAL